MIRVFYCYTNDLMAGNPNWWALHSSQSHHSSSSPLFFSDDSNPSFCTPSTLTADRHRHPSDQDFHAIRSWSQLLLGGLAATSDEDDQNLITSLEKNESNWEVEALNLNPPLITVADVKQELASQPTSRFNEYRNHDHHQFPTNTHNSCWSDPLNSSTTTAVFNFSDGRKPPPPPPPGKRQQHSHDNSSEGNSTSSGAVQPKKPRVQQSSAQPALKVRKEKLGDRITALHQLVSPFGKTDTASVLSEAIGYIRFLQAQIEALSSPYMRSTSSTLLHQHSIQERHCLLPQEASQLFNEHMDMDARVAQNQDLRSRGLCVVPISHTQHVANHSAADFWAPAGAEGSDFSNFRANRSSGSDVVSCMFPLYCNISSSQSICEAAKAD